MTYYDPNQDTDDDGRMVDADDTAVDVEMLRELSWRFVLGFVAVSAVLRTVRGNGG